MNSPTGKMITALSHWLEYVCPDEKGLHYPHFLTNPPTHTSSIGFSFQGALHLMPAKNSYPILEHFVISIQPSGNFKIVSALELT